MSRLRAIIVLGTLASVVPPASAGAQVVMGRVVARSGRVLPGVLVSLESAPRDSTPHDSTPRDSAPRDSTGAPPPEWRDSTRTGSDGVFTIFAPAPGTYRVRIGLALTGPAMTLASVDTADEREYVVDGPSDSMPVVASRGGAFEPPRMLGGETLDLSVTGSSPSGRDPLQVEIDVLIDAGGHPDLRTLRVRGRGSAENRTALERWIASAAFVPARRGGDAVSAVFHTTLRVRVEVRRM